jgi:uncharacterized membrane protein
MKRTKRIIRCLIPLLAVMGFILTAVLIQAETVPAQPTDIKTNLILNVLPGSYYDSLQVGEETGVYLEIKNLGDMPVTGIRFGAALPEGWSARFVPAELSILTAGSSNTVEAFITPPKNASGGYNATFLAEADQTRAATSAYFNLRGGSSLWLWLGIGIGVVVVLCFVVVFLRMGRH